MRLFSKIFFILSLLSVLCALSPHPIYAAACSGPGYTCRLNDCAVGEEEDTSHTCSVYDYICCKKVPTSTPAPQPTDPLASPTDTPVPTPKECKTTQDCEPLCTGIPDCSATCQNGHCYTTNPTAQPTNRCNTWGNWSACMSGQNTCGACAAQGYTCQVRYCINPPNSNQYQISCGCTQPTSPPGNNGSTPTPTAFLRLRLLNPALSPFFRCHPCHIRCDTAHVVQFPAKPASRRLILLV
jgi:hypothetical protein